MTDEDKRMYESHKEHGSDMTYENESASPSPMVQISLKEYDKLKERSMC